jgi:hypothetical protein
VLDKERKGTESVHIEHLDEHIGNLPHEVNSPLDVGVVIIITGLLKCQYIIRRFRKIAKRIICFVMSVRPSAWKPDHPLDGFCMKLYI